MNIFALLFNEYIFRTNIFYFSESAVFILWFALISTIITFILASLNFILFFTVNSKEVELQTTYECGFIPFSERRLSFNVNFYVVAILFILFDLEVLFLFPWALVLPFLGLPGFYAMVVFFIILTLGLQFEFKSNILSI